MAKKNKYLDGENDCDDTKEAMPFKESDNINKRKNECVTNDLSNSGWVDSVLKILKANKPKGKKTIVLSKAKKLTDLKKEKVKPAGFEVLTVDGEIKEEKIAVNEIKPYILNEEPLRKKKKNLPDLRIKPNILEKDKEKILQKTATKGVVQLFNAVKLQQMEINEKLKNAGPLEVKKDKVLKNIDKREFLNVLMGEKSQNIDVSIQKSEADIKACKNSENDSLWDVLKDDFMLGAKMRDWDKEMGDSNINEIHEN